MTTKEDGVETSKGDRVVRLSGERGHFEDRNQGRKEAARQGHRDIPRWMGGTRGRPEAGASPEEAAAVPVGAVQPQGGDRSPAAGNSRSDGSQGRFLFPGRL